MPAANTQKSLHIPAKLQRSSVAFSDNRCRVCGRLCIGLTTDMETACRVGFAAAAIIERLADYCPLELSDVGREIVANPYSARRRPKPSRNLPDRGLPHPAYRREPAHLGGIIGSFAVVSGLLFVDKVGAGPFAALTIGANLLMSIAVDHFGLINMPVQTVDPWRALGAVLMIAGVVLIAR